MKQSNESIPVFRVSAGTAFKAGFFGAVGFLAAQVIAGSIVAVVVIVMGVSVSGLISRSQSATVTPAADKLPRWNTTHTAVAAR